MLFLHEFGPIEAEAFLTLASELIEEDGVVTAEEDALLAEYIEALDVRGFTYDAAATAAARDTMAQLNEVSKRKVYMELYSFAVCDDFATACRVVADARKKGLWARATSFGSARAMIVST